MVYLSILAVLVQLVIVRKWQPCAVGVALLLVIFVNSFSALQLQHNPLFWFVAFAWGSAWLCYEFNGEATEQQTQPAVKPATQRVKPAAKPAISKKEQPAQAWAAEKPAFDINSPVDAELHELKGQYLAMPKLDGIFARWVPGLGLFTKNGRRITCLGHIEAAMQSSPLAQHVTDGELYSHKLKFEQINGLVRCMNATDEHKALSFNAFDLPELAGDNNAVQATLNSLLPADTAAVKRVPVTTISSTDAAAAYQQYLADNYEGMILRGEGATVYKVKPLQDAEARLIGFTPAKNANQPFNGVVLQMPCGKTFTVASLKKAQRAQLFTAGANGQLVTYSYQCLTAKGLPRFARLKDQRFDMTITEA